jgi:HEAT repeat protein/WD40 repeat protein
VSVEKSLRLIAARLRAEPESERTVERKRTLSRFRLSKLRTTATTRVSTSGGRTKEAQLSKERRESILALGRSGDARALEILTGLMGDGDTSVRAAAIESLGELQAVERLPELIELLVEPVPDLVRAACQALARIGDRRSVRPLLVLGLHEPHVKYLTSKSILDMGEASVPALLEILDDSDAGLVLEAVVLLGRLRERKGVKPLVLLIERSVAAVRAHAAEALGQIGDTHAAPVLARLLQDRDLGVRVNAAAALAKMPSLTVLRQLLQALSDADADVRVEVVQALGEVGSAEAAEPLAALLSSTDAAERAAVAEALGKLGDPRAVEPLLELVAEGQEATQVRAIGALRKFPDRRAVEALLNLVEHPRPSVRSRAVDTLGTIGGKPVVPRLAQVLKSDRAPEVRCSAVRALGEIGDPSAIPLLETALQDEFSVRCRAIVALGEIRDLAALPAVLAMLRDPLPEVRYQATVALGELGHRNGRGALEPLLEDENAMVRRGAAKALEKLGDPRGEKLHEIAARTPKKRRSRRSGSGRWSGLVPGGLRELVWPDALRGRIVSGTVALLLVGIALGAGWLAFGPSAPVSTTVAKVGALAFNSDGTRLAVGRRFGEIEVWDVDAGKRLARFAGNGDRAVAFAATSRGIGAAGNSALGVWNDFNEPKVAKTIPANTKNLLEMQLATSADHAVTLAGDGTIVRWELELGQPAGAVRLPEATRTVFAALPDASGVLGIGPTGEVVCWELPSGRTRFKIPTQVKAVTALAVSPDHKLVAVGGARGHVEILGIDQKQILVQVAPSLFGAVASIVFRPDSQGMIVQKGPVLEHYDAKGVLIATISVADAERIDAVAISPTGELVAVGGHEDTTIWLYDLKTAQFVRELLPEAAAGR